MKIWIITLFPEYFHPFLHCGVVGKFLSGERGSKQVEVQLVNLRDFANNKYKSVDDYPFGGGPGMILRADILRDALVGGVAAPLGIGSELAQIKAGLHVIYPSPRGPLWDVAGCKKMAKRIVASGQNDKQLVFICGRYEGLDERFIETYVDEQICVGNYILSGGEIAVMAILDSSFRHIPGVLGNGEGPGQESFEDSLLEGPQFTRPRVFEDKPVPEILLSGHHAKICEFQYQERVRLTKLCRPDLLRSEEKS